MDTPMDLDRLTQQTKRREYADGLRDLQVGLTILILSLLNWLILTPTGMAWLMKAILYDRSLTILALLALLGLFILIIAGAERLMERIRRASLWKESGFVKPLRWGFTKGWMVIVTAAMLGIIIASVWLMATGILSQQVALRSIPASASFGTGLLFLSIGYSLKIRRYLAVGGAGILLAILLFVIPFSFAQTWLWLGLGWTIILLVSGVWALHMAISEIRGDSTHE